MRPLVRESRLRSFASTTVYVAAFAALLVAASGCNKSSDAKPDKSKVSDQKAEIPDNVSVNPMFAGKDDTPVGLQVRGLDGGAGAADGAAPVAPAAAGQEGLTLVSNGAEPRAARVYTLSGKDARVVTIKAKVSAEMGGKTQSADAPGFKLALTIATKKDPKPVDPKATGFLLDGTLTKAELMMDASADPKAAAMSQMLAAGAGLTFETSLSPLGVLGKTSVKAEGAKDPKSAQQVTQMLPQVFDVLVIPLPKEPIGVGAQWKDVAREEGGRADKPTTITRTFTLEKVDGDKLTVKVITQKVTPRQPFPEQNAPPGTTVEVLGNGTATFVLAPGHLPTKADVTMEEKTTITVPEGKGSQSQTMTMAVTLEEGK